MPLQLSTPLKKEFKLEKTDKAFESEGTTATFRQCAQGEHDIRNELFARFTRRYHDDGDVEVTQTVSYDELRRKEVMLALADCNITDENGKPLFLFRDGRVASEDNFRRGWARLPAVTALELHEYALEMNPLWTSLGEQK